MFIMASTKRGSRTESVRKLGKLAQYSYYVTLPRADVEELGWRKGQRVTVKRVGQTIVIEDWQ